MTHKADASMGPRGMLIAPPIPETEVPQALSRLDALTLRKQRSLWGNAWRQFRRHRLAMAGMVVIVFFFIATFVGAELYPRPIDAIDFLVVDAGPSWHFPFGTDSLGQDMLARILWG